MKHRSILLIFACLLLMGTLASAGTPEQAGTLKPPAEPSFLAPAQKSPGCSDSELPSFNPAPMQKTSLCGPCSESICVGRTSGSVCKTVGTRIYKCLNVYANFCSDGSWECQCWNGPIP